MDPLFPRHYEPDLPIDNYSLQIKTKTAHSFLSYKKFRWVKSPEAHESQSQGKTQSSKSTYILHIKDVLTSTAEIELTTSECENQLN